MDDLRGLVIINGDRRDEDPGENVRENLDAMKGAILRELGIKVSKGDGPNTKSFLKG